MSEPVVHQSQSLSQFCNLFCTQNSRVPNSKCVWNCTPGAEEAEATFAAGAAEEAAGEIFAAAEAADSRRAEGEGASTGAAVGAAGTSEEAAGVAEEVRLYTG